MCVCAARGLIPRPAPASEMMSSDDHVSQIFYHLEGALQRREATENAELRLEWEEEVSERLNPVRLRPHHPWAQIQEPTR